MQKYKYFLVVLLFLISLTSIFNVPGVGNFELFNNYLINQRQHKNRDDLATTLIKYPPGVYLVLTTLLNNFTLNSDIKIFNTQTVWTVFKLTLFTSYLLTWLALLYLMKSVKKNKLLSTIDISIAFFGSIAILLSSVGLGYFDIYSVPFLILSFAFVFRKQFIISSIFYFLALTFNWSLLILSPLFFITALRNKGTNTIRRVLQFFLFAIIPISILLVYISNLTKLQPHYLLDLLKYHSLTELKVSVQLPWLFWLSFILIYLKLIYSFLQKNISNVRFTSAALYIYLIFILFIPDVGVGRLVWIPLFSLIIYLLDKTNFTKLQLVVMNVLVFINIFSIFGTSGIVPMRGEYFNFFGTIFLICLIAYISWLLVSLHKLDFLSRVSGSLIKKLTYNLKYFLIFLMIALNLVLIAADGSSDHISWTQYAQASITFLNPFRAYTEVILQYPPLSIVTISFFANLWNSIIGPSPDYAIATKLSIFTFYILTILTLLKIGNSAIKNYKLSIIDKLLVLLTTFSLIIQTQGLADINIYVIPSLFWAIYLLFKKRFLLSGILMGLTVAIKWQPVILLPLFAITLLNLEKGGMNILRVFLIFSLGFVIIPVVSWIMVLMQPGGFQATARAFDFFTTEGLLLSGQALNINWVATYMLHLVDPVKYGSIADLDGLNRQIVTYTAPWFLRGQFFYIVSLAIIIYYWRIRKKELASFLSAATLIFLSHYQLNKSAYEKHLFYVVILMLFLYLIRPTISNRRLLILFDVMTVMNLIFFYGFTGTEALNRLFFGFDLTVLFSVFYFIIFLWVFVMYLKRRILT